MAIEGYKPTGQKVKSEPQDYDVDRTVVTLEPGTRIRNALLVDTRSKSNETGPFLIIFIDDAVETDGHYMMFVSADLTPNKNVFGRQFMSTFLEKDEVTQYWVVKPEFEGKPVWIGKAPVAGKKYHTLEWGYEDVVDAPETESKKEAVAEPSDEVLADALLNGKSVNDAAKELTKTGLKPAEALRKAKDYYSKNAE